MNIHSLNEMPITVDIDKNLMIKKFEETMKHHDESSLVSTGIKDFFIVGDTTHSYIIHYTKENGVTAFMKFSQGAVDNGNKRIPIIQQSDTLNKKQIVKGFTVQSFKEISKTFKRPILIDYKNSKEMEDTFKKWIHNPESFGIKDFFVYDNKLKKILKDGSELEDEVWDTTPQANRYSIIFDFFDYIVERQYDLNDDQQEREKFRGSKIFFDKESFDKRKTL